MTPFEAALELSNANATSQAIPNAVGDVVNARNARNFQLLAQQREFQNGQQRDAARLNQEAAIRENQRQTLRTEGANQLFARVKQSHPDFNPDPGAPIEDNIASAQKLLGDDVVKSTQPIADAYKQEAAEQNAVLKKYGAFQPADPNRVNQLLQQDPTLTTGNFPVLGPKEIALLNSGKSPEDIAKNFSLTSNQVKLLNSAQAIRQTLQQQQLAVAQEKAGVELKQVQDKYSPYHQLGSNVLSTISQNYPERLGEAASIFAKAATPDQQGGPQVNPDGTLKFLNPGSGNPPAAVPPTGAGSLPPSSDPRINDIGVKAHKSAYTAAQNNVAALQAQVDTLGKQLDANDDPTGTIGAAYIKAKADLDKATVASTEALKNGWKAHGAAFGSAIGNYPGGSNYTGPTFILGQAQNGIPLPTPWTNSPPFNLPVSGQPSLPPPSAPIGAPQQPAPIAGAPNQQSTMQTMAIKNKLTSLFGTADTNVFQAAGNYSKSVLGTSDQQNQATLQAALGGDQDAISKVKNAIQAVTAGQGQQTPPPAQGDNSLPPMVSAASDPNAGTNDF